MDAKLYGVLYHNVASDQLDLLIYTDENLARAGLSVIAREESLENVIPDYIDCIVADYTSLPFESHGAQLVIINEDDVPKVRA